MLQKRSHVGRSQPTLDNDAIPSKADVEDSITRAGMKIRKRKEDTNHQMKLDQPQRKRKTANQSAMNEVQAYELFEKRKAKWNGARKTSHDTTWNKDTAIERCTVYAIVT